ncbi:MAG: helix-turn-helix domain-containing protein [Candidatus Aenigmarchaeota archaeon]|nr:helix-turn-helix domain-containing protein [Candidatus Aenigmarchaeota archaeon]
MANHFLPGIRSLIARELIENHKLTQKEAARRLGTTQPAISQYKKHLRGNKTKILENNKKINKKISDISYSLAKKNMSHEELNKEFCNLCKIIRKNT